MNEDLFCFSSLLLVFPCSSNTFDHSILRTTLLTGGSSQDTILWPTVQLAFRQEIVNGVAGRTEAGDLPSKEFNFAGHQGHARLRDLFGLWRIWS